MLAPSQLEPRDLGLPPKFSAWRPGQWPSLQTALSASHKFIAQCAPTGFGKSLWAMAYSILDGSRAVILTGTKALEDQYFRDFQSCGIFDMRGRNNFDCVKAEDSDRALTCAEGRILGCQYPSCAYNAARRAFLDSNLSVTNYAYGLSSMLHSEGCGDIGTLVLDEAHSAVQEICSAVEIRLDHVKYDWIYRAVNAKSPPFGKPLVEWRTWATYLRPKVQDHIKSMKEAKQYKWISQVDTLAKSLDRVAGVSGDWILDEQGVLGETLISPLWPVDFAGPLLFRDVPRVILLSATLVPKTLALLGIKEEESIFLSQSHTFDPSRAPVYLFGPSHISRKSTPGQLDEWMSRMDRIIYDRLDRKGIIHTVSYDRQEFIFSRSTHRSIMLAPRDSRSFQAAVEQFKSVPAPCVLVTPSATTGYDFPYDECEYQILSKVPFIPTSPLMEARKKADPEYAPYLIAQVLVQTCGRAMRAEDDRCENFILDANANWFLMPRERGGHKHLFPSWFLQQVRKPDGLPVPAPKLQPRKKDNTQ